MILKPPSRSWTIVVLHHYLWEGTVISIQRQCNGYACKMYITNSIVHEDFRAVDLIDTVKLSPLVWRNCIRGPIIILSSFVIGVVCVLVCVIQVGNVVSQQGNHSFYRMRRSCCLSSLSQWVKMWTSIMIDRHLQSHCRGLLSAIRRCELMQEIFGLEGRLDWKDQ